MGKFEELVLRRELAAKTLENAVADAETGRARRPTISICTSR